MLIRADLHHQSTAEPYPVPATLLPAIRAGAALDCLRERREQRRAAIWRHLADARAVDAIVPGLSRLEVGPGNDKLRAFRYAPDDMGARLLSVDPIELHAALVVQRILCWRAKNGD